MNTISIDELRRFSLDETKEFATDEYYLTLANYIVNLRAEMDVFPEFPPLVIKHVALSLVSYYQDIVSDMGLWRAFVTMHRNLYGKPVPFYDESEDYIDFELNLIDVQFVIWYSLEAQMGFSAAISPYDKDILRFAKKVTKLFRFLYDDAPIHDAFKPLRELDLTDREQVRDIFKASSWLFWNSYFLRPVSKHLYEPCITEDEELTIDETLTNADRLRTTYECATGPLSLFADEWLWLILNNELPKNKTVSKGSHKYYDKFISVTGGARLVFFQNYKELDDFLATKMEWGADSLSQLKDYANFIVYGNPNKGILIAPEVAQYVKHDNNPLYDSTIAESDAHAILLEPGRCPVDLVRFLFEKNLVPDATYPTGEFGKKILHDNWDFLARLYLCKYYREE